MSLRKNLGLKITAVVIALGLWAWVAGQVDVIKTVSVPVDLTGLPADLEIVGNTVDDISVRLTGPEITLRTLPQERLRLRVNLATHPLAIGLNQIPVSPSQISVPAGIRVDRLTPNVLDLEVEAKATLEVPILPEVRGEPANGFELAGTVVQPPKLLIEGPESAVRAVESLSTPTIPIDGQSSNQTLRVRPIARGSEGSRVRLADASATVQVLVRIRPIQLERTLEGLSVVTEGATEVGLTPDLDPQTVQVEVSGPREVVAMLAPGQFQAVLDLTSLTTEITEVDAPGLSVRPLDPEALPWQDLRFQITSPDVIRLSWKKKNATN